MEAVRLLDKAFVFNKPPFCFLGDAENKAMSVGCDGASALGEFGNERLSSGDGLVDG